MRLLLTGVVGLPLLRVLRPRYLLLRAVYEGPEAWEEPFHLFRYLDEQTCRFNNRKLTDQERFVGTIKQIVGRRLTYEELTGKLETDPG